MTVNGVIEALKEGKTMAISTAKTEQAQDRPERGKLVIDQERLEYVRKWAWFDWIGIALLLGKHQVAIKVFV
jgi:hypothetical protein